MQSWEEIQQLPAWLWPHRGWRPRRSRIWRDRAAGRGLGWTPHQSSIPSEKIGMFIWMEYIVVCDAGLIGFADLSDDLRQPGVAHHQPAAGSDAVGFVLELVRLHFVEVLKAARKTTACVVIEHAKAAAVCAVQKGTAALSPFTPSLRVSLLNSETYTVALRMSEWIWATPFTAWEPTMHKWAMLILFCPPSSMSDIRRRRSWSPGNLAETFCATEKFVGGLVFYYILYGHNGPTKRLQCATLTSRWRRLIS